MTELQDEEGGSQSRPTKPLQRRRGLASVASKTPWRPAVSLASSAMLLSLIFVVLLAQTPGASGIDCFKCVSLNGDNPSCEDPFHNNFSARILESPCMAGRKHREGLFPATACIKLAGIFDRTGKTIMVRACALDSGTLTTDTEIIRMSHCGGFYFDDKYVKGCLQSCDDYDGCNRAVGILRSTTAYVIAPILLESFSFLLTGTSLFMSGL